MANYRKSFNLRNGVQVDDDNFIVNSNGLVGIGTTVPTEILDVIGNARVVGIITSNRIYAGVATFRSASVETGLAVSGVVTATSFSGSASGLTDIYAIAVDGWYISSGTISTTSNVGINTLNPVYSLQIGNDPNSGNGISFDSATGNIKSSGSIEGSSFIGPLNASSLTTGTVDNARLPSQINVGVVTASTGFFGNLVGIASTSRGLIGNPDISVGVVTSGSINSNFINVSISTITSTLRVGSSGTIFTNFGSNIGIGTTLPLQRLSIFGGNLEIRSSSNIPYVFLGEKIGIGSFLPSSDIHLRRTNQAQIQVTSDSDASLIGFGRSENITGFNGVLRYGNTSPIFPYSTPQSLDILNYGSGNVNFYLEASNVGGGSTGSFYWHRRPNFSRLMSLTYDGKLGIGITLPTDTLHVVGTSTVTGRAYFNGDVIIEGNLQPNSIVLNEISATLQGNVNSTSGISTFNNIKVNGSGTFDDISVSGATADKNDHIFNLNNTSSRVFVDTAGNIGIKTTVRFVDGINAPTSQIVAAGLGIGTTTLKCAVDFSNSSLDTVPQAAFMLPPKITTSQRNSLSPIEGALIYNSSSKRLELYTGSSWVGIATVA